MPAPVPTDDLAPEGIASRLCSRCREWWPATAEFFRPLLQRPGLSACWCRACEAEYARLRRGRLLAKGRT